jgi:1-aminocyclopropane-1-carboxylate synthase
MGDLYDPSDNSNGAILMSIAENKLCNETMLSRMQEVKCLPSSVMNYTDPTGVAALKVAMADCLTDHVFCIDSCSSDGEEVPRVKPEQLVISAGCTGLLFQLSVLMFERGDSILIPTPYYPAFDQDFGFLGGVHRVPIDPSNLSTYELTLSDLEAAHALALELKQPPKALLLTNPHNPLGKIFTPAELLMVVAWCREHRIHLICDEIYALSVFNTSADGPFHSIAALLNNQLGDFVHVLWGVSKDLGGSGLRVGVLYSHNKALLAAVGGSSTAFQVSNVIQAILAETLADVTFMKALKEENCARILQSFELLTTGFRKLNIPFYNAGAGIFVFVDMRRLLKENSFAGERELHLALVKEIKWSLTPGEPCHHVLPGFFRVCYCWVTPEAIVECLRRLEKFIETRLAGDSTEK